MRRCLLALCPVAVLLLGPAAARGESPRPLVTTVELRADAPVDSEGLTELVVAEPGAPLDLDTVRRSLRNLQASGVAGAVEALTLPDEGGVRLVLALTSLVRVTEVAVEGELGIRRTDLEAAVVQTEATPLSESRVVRSVYRLQDVYREYGYAEPRVRVEVDTRDRRATVTFRVDSGPRTTIEAVRLLGLPAALEESELKDHLRLQPGHGLVESRVRDDRERLEDRLHRAGYRTARVELPERVPGSAPGKIELLYPIEVGPRIALSVLGVDEQTLRRRGLLEAFDSQPFDEALVLQTARAIRRDYQTRGHYRARVDWGTEDLGETLRVSLLVQPGPLYELREIGFRGNQWATSAVLRDHMESAPRRGLRAGGRLVDDLLQEDLANLRAFYALEGFPEAKVGPPEVEESGSELRVLVPIEEGRRQQVVDLTIDGLAGTGVEVAPGDLALEGGGPFHPRRLEESLEELRAALEDSGYLSAQVSSTLDWSDDRRRVRVRLQVLPGPRAVVDRVIVRGNQRTETRLVRRVLGLRPDSPLSRQSLLEAQRRLYQLGIFSRVEVRMAPAPPFTSRRDVLVRLTEGSARRLTYGVGYDSEDGLRGLLGYTHANLLGRAVSARFDLRLSTRTQQVRLLAHQPYVSRYGIPMTYSLFLIEEEQDSFTSRRRGGQVEAERLRDGLRLGLLYTFKIVELREVDVSLEEIAPALRDVEISSLTPSLFLDRRDDPLLPTRGWTAGLQTEYAFPLANADAEFVKLFGQVTSHLPLGRLGVLAGSFRLGAIEPLAGAGIEDTTVPAGLESRRIPISERFFAGGRNSHRAYRRDRLGVTGETIKVEEASDPAARRRVPLGGNALLLFNLDYRFPIVGPLGGTLFVDSGNVWADWRGLDIGGLKAGVGAGLRYLSPIGPLRLEVGWKLDRESGEDPAVVFLSFGNPF